MGYVTAEAPTRTELSTCVQCGLCLPHCPTFRLTGMETASPRGRLMAMSAVLEGVAEVDDVFAEIIDFCLGCRACEAVCPGLTPYGRLLEGARAEIAAQRPTRARRLRRWLLGRALGNRTAVSLATTAAAVAQRTGAGRLLPRPLRRSFAGLRRLEAGERWVGRRAEPVGEVRGTVALLAGCVMEPWFPQVHEATVGLLRRAGYRVVVPRQQTCCGALAAHDGHAADARRMARRNVVAFAGADLVVADAAGCSAHLKEYGHWADEAGAGLAERVRDVTELVAELIDGDLLPRLALPRGPVAVQDPCHLRHAQRIVEPPRTILRAAGYEPVEIDVDAMCCGAAGTYAILRPDTSLELGERKAEQIRASGSTIVASANPGCEMQLRSLLGSAYRVAHPVELYWEALVESTGRVRPEVGG